MVNLSLVSGRCGCKRCIPYLKIKNKKDGGVEALRWPGQPKAAKNGGCRKNKYVKTVYFLEILFGEKVEYFDLSNFM